MEASMQLRRKTTNGFILAAILATMGSVFPGTASRADETTGERWKPRTELQLTEDFYQALRSEGAKTYTTGASDEYLRQIAVSTRFMVETNLQLLQQQKRIIQLLEELKARPAKP
jgi:hypothetical protein